MLFRSREEQEHSAEAIARKKQEQEELMKDPAVQEQIRKMMKAHWKSWYSERIPALGDLTPLEASKSSEGRELLEALLLEYEQENQKQENPLLRADIPSMRKRLGLPNRDS